MCKWFKNLFKKKKDWKDDIEVTCVTVPSFNETGTAQQIHKIGDMYYKMNTVWHIVDTGNEVN